MISIWGWAFYTNLPGGLVGLSHSGHDDGVNTILLVLLEPKRGLVIFTNSDNGWMVYSDLVSSFLGSTGRRIATIEMAK
ncbi:MAG: hypothetical protein KGM98_08890 [Bacteroidota bacterium]|nr:hypothetical protein [Bacteroidota bacterium]